MKHTLRTKLPQSRTNRMKRLSGKTSKMSDIMIYRLDLYVIKPNINYSAVFVESVFPYFTVKQLNVFKMLIRIIGTCTTGNK